jgi:hypothetical protein
VWTVTNIRLVDSDQTQVTAVTIVDLTRVTDVVTWLSARVKYLYVKRLCQCALYHGYVRPCKSNKHVDECLCVLEENCVQLTVPLVSSDDRVSPPVCPVDVVLKQCDGERMTESLVTTHHFSV